MKDCPTCGLPVDGLVCPRCNTGKAANKAAAGQDPDWWRCCDTDTAGNRCSKPGALSDSTFGKGPWYCRDHYPSFRYRGGASRTPPPGGFVSLKQALGMVPMREPGEEG